MNNQNEYLEDDGLENTGFSMIILLASTLLFWVILSFAIAGYYYSKKELKRQDLWEEVTND